MYAIPNEFQEYQFEEEEALRAMVFTPEQLANLSNQRSRISRDILNLTVTRKDYDANLDQLIHLKGQQAMITLLFDQHAQASEELQALASQHASQV